MENNHKTIITVVAVFLFLVVATAAGRTIWNNYWSDVQQADVNTSYETQKKVEDTARAYISSYNSDVDIYNAYCNSEDENLRAYAESAKMRAIRTANSYNDYLQKNSYVWRDNMPRDLPSTLSTDIGKDTE